MDVNLALRKGYFKELNGSISFNSKAVKIYDTFANPNDEVEYPYIILSTIRSGQISVKRCYHFDASINIDIVTGSLNNIGREDSEIISDQIQNLLLNLNFTDLDLSDYGYTVGDTRLTNNLDMTSKSNAYYIFRKILTFNHLINKI
ncbi:hypothetical protein Phi18:2_gp52 [Cellulophaga phage phi18:2]|uniref:Uncharacterized protein n=5 Tax=Helsingorvirus TaxID=1918017 RepID=R9ZXN6_9CAUD|nr:hypothetical protein Phi18:1_gp54 [Cellulophaga phage phi18:1]YP_008241032.1 hypothetical protein Phi12:1_gp53 [Cellulophaga phage phi12:1]YP_008241370.1 hypothetical protein Phi17:1_gp54 [Cellulophaga phage phi17:1]AGO48184.1 hypothetical protein Phi12:3_gp53 [Cellulophaga phage phi12:3]AGO49215.1 hypothetical protein Phi18:2_gp52 [Cellulophaga phage phi18:2]AGO48019.1 hypothetical protein Phi12:1_gp53 [Cellulophaga phage phi12:1]AGO48330.1 hypothetical protein Phi17:1_gp54 [Cellulophaga 